MKGYDVHLISLVRPNVRLDGINLHIVPPAFNRVKVIDYWLRSFYVRRLIREISPDIIHAVSTAGPGFWGAFGKVAPLVIWAWGGDVIRVPFVSKNKDIKDKLLAIPWRTTIIYALKKADIIYVESRYMAKFLHKMFNLPMEKIRNFIWGVDMNKFSSISNINCQSWYSKLDISPSQPVVLSPRSMQPPYRIDVVLRSVPLVAEEHKDIVYIFLKGYADSDYIEMIRELVKQLKIEQNVRIIDYLLTSKELGALMSISNIYVSIPIFEAFPITVLEGLLFGCVPILSDIPANRELAYLGVKALWVKGDSPEELANVVSESVRRKIWLDKKLVEKNKEVVIQNATMEVSVNEMEKLYWELLPRKQERE
jgi:glycosyltransferase involved in cell wall biosynthesis